MGGCSSCRDIYSISPGPTDLFSLYLAVAVCRSKAWGKTCRQKSARKNSTVGDGSVSYHRCPSWPPLPASQPCCSSWVLFRLLQPGILRQSVDLQPSFCAVCIGKPCWAIGNEEKRSFKQAACYLRSLKQDFDIFWNIKSLWTPRSPPLLPLNASHAWLRLTSQPPVQVLEVQHPPNKFH